MDTTPQGLIDLNNRMRADASGMISLWDECGRMTLTRRVDALTSAINRTASVNDSFTPYDAAILNSTAVEAAAAHAAGCAAWITPADQQWFMWEPVGAFKKDSVKSWLAECADIARMYLAASNFYTKTHELYLDRVVFGTGALMAETGRKSALNFRVFDAGSYVMADDEEGDADLIIREHTYSARQAEEKFGRESLPPRVAADLAGKPTSRHRFLHCIRPRPVEERDRESGPRGMAYASLWLAVDDKMMVQTGGFEELPVFINRYLRWSEFSPWGASPAMQALAEIRGLNFMEVLLATLAEVTVTPRIILPQGFSGVPDLRAGGITMGGLTRDTFPQEWGTGGRFDIGLGLLERKERAINNIFHRPLFDQFAQLERQITAAEVHAREAEKVARFSPAFHQLTTELINPVMQRVFMLLFRQDKFPPPPAEALYRDAAGNMRLAFPQTVQTSRMALAMQALKKTAFSNMLMLFSSMKAGGSEVFDNLDEDEAFRDLTRGDGLPPSYLRDTEARDAIRQKRAQAEQAMQQASMAQAAMKSAPLVQAGVDEMKAQAQGGEGMV